LTIKENRTYDQVLGDIPEGNGEVSADGHNWTMGAYATDSVLPMQIGI